MNKYRLLIFDWEGTLMMPNRELYDQTQETLITLKKDYLLAVATNRTRRGLDQLLVETKLQNMFITSRCADETDLKPNPRMLQEILDELEVSASQAIMVGDSEADMQMAKRIGIDRIVACYGSHPLDWQHYQPLLCFQHIRELMTFLSA